ncbi:MAG: dTDP-glucose 4,6-dehydratase [Thermaerobacter sp.]|nr:dTDP-glucose 4,6-dehydratase [Thermaerobacter sp.]
MRLLITGGAGFIGSAFVRLLLSERPDWQVADLDLLTYAGNLENLETVEGHPHHRFVRGDLADRALVESLFPVDAVVNFAAESHVDRSIQDPERFLATNVLGTHALLEAARQKGLARFVQVSTDEVYGSIEKGLFTEDSPLSPRSPYSASKAAADHLCLAYHHTYGLPVLITRSSNNYGPYQFPEKLIPLLVTNALEGKDLPLYGDGENVRDWLFVEDNCRGVLAALERGRPGGVYNLGGGAQRTNREVAEAVRRLVGGPSRVVLIPDRPGHDRRYALDCRHARRELGWRPTTDFEAGLAATVAWYREHRAWWERVKSGEYRRYYEAHYGPALAAGSPA